MVKEDLIQFGIKDDNEICVNTKFQDFPMVSIIILNWNGWKDTI